jgi:formylglycine-generating enzyme required for sulfatase activity
MGSPEGEEGRWKDREAQHEVTIAQPFYLGKYEVTQAQYEALVRKEKNQSHFKGADLPVENVNWNEADNYAKEWTRKTNDKRVYRLPREDEWEYACRGGAFSKDSLPFSLKGGPSSSLTHGQINFDSRFPYGDGKKGEPRGRTAPCGSFPEAVNAFGLYDMHGNVWEWTDTLGGSGRVMRGASWDHAASYCRAAFRGWNVPSWRYYNLGFRLAAVPSSR